MNPASCLFPTWPGPEPRKGRRRSSATCTNRIASLRSVRWPSRPNGNGWRSISRSAPAISRDWMSAPSSSICFDMCGGPWCCSGIEARSIAAARSSSGLRRIPDSTSRSSPPTRRNSILQNMSGPKPTALWRTAPPRICASSRGCFVSRSDASEARNRFSGPASTRQTCRGPDECAFLYLCEAQ